MLLKGLFEAPQRGIFAIINEFDKRIYVSYTKDLQARLGTISSEILNGLWKFPLMTEDRNKLTLKVLESSEEKVFVKYYIDHYRNLGYTVYNENERVPLELHFGLVFGVDERSVNVVAINKRNDKIVLGKFRNIETATRFLEYAQKYNASKNLVYAIK